MREGWGSRLGKDKGFGLWDGGWKGGKVGKEGGRC